MHPCNIVHGNGFRQPYFDYTQNDDIIKGIKPRFYFEEKKRKKKEMSVKKKKERKKKTALIKMCSY